MIFQRSRPAGFSLLEVLVATVILAMIGAIVMNLTLSGQTILLVNQNISIAGGEMARSLHRLVSELRESSIDIIYTARIDFHRAAGNAVTENHWSHNSGWHGGFRQCTNAACPWSQPGDDDSRLPFAYVTSQYTRGGLSVSSNRRGALLPHDGTNTCPVCGQGVANNSYLDGVMFFTPRRKPDATHPMGEFVSTEGWDTAPDWHAVVLYWPYYDRNLEMMQLRRYAVYLDELVNDAASQQELAWIDWDFNNPAGEPTLINLFDFSTNGTSDAVPDGWVPVTGDADQADADREDFYFYSSATTDYVVFHKVLGGGGVYPYRENFLRFDLGSGEIIWLVRFDNNAGSYWRHVLIVNRAPETLVVGNHFRAIDISTYQSNPYDAVLNPFGVSNENSVRISLVFDKPLDRGQSLLHADQYTLEMVTPRNARGL